MTKYILHGGNTNTKSEDNNKFFLEIIKDLSSPVNLLIVYFSREEEEWPKLIKQDKEVINSIAEAKQINFVLASKDKEAFIKQLEGADAIYMRGGETPMLKESLSQMGDLKKLFVNKVVAGSSAGANVLSRYYFSPRDGLMEGFGVLPIKVFVHYDDTCQGELEKLKSHGETLTTYPVEEMKFVVLEGK